MSRFFNLEWTAFPNQQYSIFTLSVHPSLYPFGLAFLSEVQKIDIYSSVIITIHPNPYTLRTPGRSTGPIGYSLKMTIELYNKFKIRFESRCKAISASPAKISTTDIWKIWLPPIEALTSPSLSEHSSRALTRPQQHTLMQIPITLLAISQLLWMLRDWFQGRPREQPTLLRRQPKMEPMGQRPNTS